VQATGGTLAAVLVSGLTAAASGTVGAVRAEPRRALVAVEERRPVQPPPAPQPPAPAPPSEPEGIEALGPPPGPQVDLRPERVAAPQDRYALLAGVSDYRPPTVDTIGSANDVRALADHLVQSGWRPENVRVLLDGQVTGAALREGMAWLADRGQAGTFSFFHWSGHVKRLGGGTEALWPVDRDWVRDREVTAALSRVQGRLWVDVAGCEAGSFLPGLPSDRVLVSASSRDVEKSYEYPEWGKSVWTGLLLDLGIRQGGADADGDGRVTMGEALRYATYYAQSITWLQRPHGKQTPQVEGDPVRGWTLADPPA
jgi:hypothetical protein